MPTKRSRRTRGRIVTALSPAMVRFLETGEFPTSDADGAPAVGWVEVGQKSGDDAALRADWLAVRDDMLGEWLHEHPGTRPWGWWRFDAPRWQRADLPERVRDLGDVFLQHIAEPRRRLGGIGTPSHECLNVVPYFDRGISLSWVSPFDEAYYNGRSRDIYGTPIGTDYHDGDFDGLTPRVDDPPRFESEAAYLDRHGLLTAAERRRLPANAFDPEVLAIEADDEIDPRAKFPDTLDGPVFDERYDDDQ